MIDLEVITNPDRLVAVLNADKRRYAYEGADRAYYVTYEGGKVQRTVIDDAENRGLIVRRYPDKTVNAWMLPPRT